MNFFAQQALARARARRLIWLFVAAVIAVVVSVDVIVMIVVSMLAASHPAGSDSFRHSIAVTPGLGIWVGLIVLGIVSLGTAYRSTQLSAGGNAVAQQLGAERVQHDTHDPLRRRLWNVVEEMSIASGVPIPAIYVLENEQGINAFAAGHSTSDAAITVTRGALDHLNRDELQGVIGHEFSHILNGDMRVNIRLMGMLFGLLVIGTIGQFVMRGSARGGGKKGGIIVLGGLAVMILGYVGLFLGRLIQAAVSRQCESVADASSVQFTRDTLGLRNALVKIGALEQGSLLQTPQAAEVSHMLFAAGFKRAFATHPPLIERIRVLDPSFDEKEFAQVGAKLQTQQLAVDTDDSADEKTASSGSAGMHGLVTTTIAASGIAGMVGNPDTQHIEIARRIRASLPADVVADADDPARAVGVLWSLLLDTDAGIRKLQLEALQNDFGARHAELASAQYERIAAVDVMLRLPLLMRLMPALRRLSQADRARVLNGVERLVRIDGKVTVYEYALSKLVQQGLADSAAASRTSRELKLSDVTADLQVVFSVVAWQGSDDPTLARRAYELGMSQLFPRDRPAYAVPADWVPLLDAALVRLDQLVPAGKEAFVEAMVKTIALDDQLAIAEAELLRAICATIHCPLPPLGATLPPLDA